MRSNDFEYKNLGELKKMSLEELSAYFRKMRDYEFRAGIPLETSDFKKRIYNLTKLILRIDRLISKRTMTIYDDKRENNINKGKVYASTHVGRYDIESAMEAIGEQVYFVMGDPEETYRNFEGFFLDKIQGRICMDTGYQISEIIKKKRESVQLTKEEKEKYEEYKRDRHICELVCTQRILNKDNILIYPEGAWNVTPRLVQSLFPGTAKIAINGNGTIIPIGIVRNNKNYIVNIGKEMNLENATIQDVKEVTKELKEKMSSLVGEIIFNENKINPRTSFKDAKSNEIDYREEIMSESENGYTLDIIEKTRYFDPNYPENVKGIKH